MRLKFQAFLLYENDAWIIWTAHKKMKLKFVMCTLLLVLYGGIMYNLTLSQCNKQEVFVPQMCNNQIFLKKCDATLYVFRIANYESDVIFSKFKMADQICRTKKFS